MLRRIVECIPNFSEGRNPVVIDRIVEAVVKGPGVAILGRTMDPDHHRSVLTFAGPPEAVAAAAVRAVAEAVKSIDLNFHSGVHPRLGAADVIPFVPITGVTLEDCARIATGTAEEIWRTLHVPSYLYEAAARRPDRVQLECVRRGEFEGLRRLVHETPEARPDIGGPELHPTAGACIVGARKVLLAYNINLETSDVGIAREIARQIRTSSGGFAHVKALGLMLSSRNQAQVSMNLTDYEQASLHTVYEAVRSLAASLGTAIAGSEIIGLMPRAAIEAAAQSCLQLENLSREVILEDRIAETLPSEADLLLDALADPEADRKVLNAAILASKAIRVCRLSGLDGMTYREDRDFFKDLSANPRPARICRPAKGLQTRLDALRKICIPHLREEIDAQKED